MTTISLRTQKLNRRHVLASIGATTLSGFGVKSWHGASKAKAPRIVIIGAGLAGLSTAFYLREAGFFADIYEGMNRTGGRVHTVHRQLDDDTHVDLGAELVNEDHYDVHRLAKRFNLKYFDNLAALEQNKNIPDQIYLHQNEKIPESELIRLFTPLSKSVHDDIKALESDYDATSARIDELTVAQYLETTPELSEAASGLVEASIRSEYGIEIDEASALQLLYNAPTTAGGSFDLIGGSDERFVFLYGSSSLPDALHRHLHSRVQLGRILSEIALDNIGRYLLKFTDGVEVEADYLVLTCSPPALRNLEFSFPLPEAIQNSINTGRLGQNEKIFAGFHGRPWRDLMAFQGGVWSNHGFATAWDATVRSGEEHDGALSFFLGGDLVNEAKGAAAEEGTRLISILDKSITGIADQASSRFVRSNWKEEPLIGGAYSSFRPGELTSNNRIVWVEEAGSIQSSVRARNLFFAGEYWSESYNGFMNGAIETGRLTASTIIKENS